jgi:hypothetical protein
VAIVLPRQAANKLRALGQLTVTPISDMPQHLEWIFHPGAVETIDRTGYVSAFRRGVEAVKPLYSAIRIDVTLDGGATLYFFVRRSHAAWDIWWETLYGFLAALPEVDLTWKVDPTQGGLCARYDLSVEQTARLLSMLRSAPPKELAEHKTLQESIERLACSDARAGLTFFREPS